MKLSKVYIFTIVSVLILIYACKTTAPEGITPVTNFDQKKYLGKWYEIARLDYKYERDLDHVTAEYSLKDDGTIKVLNRGFNFKKKVWEESEGKAKAVGDDNIAALKVSFFGPFYSGYNVIALDPDYNYAMVAGESKEYLWLLSRTTSMPLDIKKKYLNLADSIGYRPEQLVWVNQE